MNIIFSEINNIMCTQLSANFNVLVRNLSLNGSIQRDYLDNIPQNISDDIREIYKYLKIKFEEHDRQYNFEKLINPINKSESAYNNARTIFRSIVEDLNNNNNMNLSCRVVSSIVDGNVIFDSSCSDDPKYQNSNTYTHAYNFEISENHNTRVSFMTSQMFSNGIGYETKYSSSTEKIESGVAFRIGFFGNSVGTIRYSAYFKN